MDSAIDGAYATAYQDVLWALYDSNPEYFAGVLGSDYITDAERNKRGCTGCGRPWPGQTAGRSLSATTRSVSGWAAHGCRDL